MKAMNWSDVGEGDPLSVKVFPLPSPIRSGLVSCAGVLIDDLLYGIRIGPGVKVSAAEIVSAHLEAIGCGDKAKEYTLHRHPNHNNGEDCEQAYLPWEYVDVDPGDCFFVRRRRGRQG